MNRKLLFAALGGISLCTGLCASSLIVPIGRYSFEAGSGGAEIISYDTASKRLFSTRGNGIEIIDASVLGNMTKIATIDLRASFGPIGLDAVSSVEIDPLGRGFGIASLIPKDSNLNTGKLVFFDVNTGSVLNTLNTGYHPDAVTFSKDGSQIFVANEAQYTPGGPQARGSISYIELGAGFAKNQVSGLSNNSVNTVDFSASNLGNGASIDVLRYHADGDKVNLIEPEYVTARNGKAYVTLQENNGIAVFDTATQKWEAIHNLGTIDQRIDASDRDGGIFVDDVVTTMPMPDTVKSYETNGKTLLVMVNEGDYRVDDGDRVRVKNANLDPTYKATLDTSDAGLGRLLISSRDGLNENGQIEQIHTFGSRSFSIVDPLTGERIFDSGSFFEDYVAANDPLTFNYDHEEGSPVDKRSDNKGPEPEALALGEINGRTYAFIGMERQGGLFVFDITNPDLMVEAMFVTYLSTIFEGDLAPESIIFLSADESPNGKATILVAFEDSETIVAYDVSAIPEPAEIALLIGAGCLITVVLRRRKRS